MKSEVEEAGKGDPFAARQSGTERVETREEFELDKSRFMQQPRPPVENEAGFQQR